MQFQTMYFIILIYGNITDINTIYLSIEKNENEEIQINRMLLVIV